MFGRFVGVLYKISSCIGFETSSVDRRICILNKFLKKYCCGHLACFAINTMVCRSEGLNELAFLEFFFYIFSFMSVGRFFYCGQWDMFLVQLARYFWL